MELHEQNSEEKQEIIKNSESDLIKLYQEMDIL